MLFRGFIFHFPQRRLRDPIVIGWLRVEHWRYAPRYQAKLEATHGNDSDRRSDRSSTRRRWLLWPWPLVWEASTINVSAVCCAAGSGSSPIGGIFGPPQALVLVLRGRHPLSILPRSYTRAPRPCHIASGRRDSGWALRPHLSDRHRARRFANHRQPAKDVLTRHRLASDEHGQRPERQQQPRHLP